MSRHQVQMHVRTHYHGRDSTGEWRDIVSVVHSNRYGPGTKAQAKAMLERRRRMNPQQLYRIIKLID
jgi:hypothetical protein